ncbi:MAG: BMP family ABC transporter substrate-binding protein [Microbacteriaceae bacterium]
MTILSRGRVLSGLALVGVSAIALVGCASAPEDDSTSTASTAAIDFLPCMVSDAGGFDDKAFNQLGFEGLQEAAGSLGVDYQTAESTSDSDYTPNIDSLIADGCDLIITVGYNLSAATVTAAQANPDIEFAIIDDAADNDYDGVVDSDNIKPILFDTAQAAFLAGYATASYTSSGIIATWGGMNYPTVSIFSDGLAQGIDYYNEQNGTDVELIGYDPDNPDDYTVTGGFEANDTAKQTAANFIDQGADILVPVGGPIFQSAGAAIEDSGKDIALVGVDADVYDTYPTYDSLYFTSILKNIAPAVNDVVTTAAEGAFDTTAYLGTLENGGVGIADFHDYADKVDPDLESTLSDLSDSIISGDITVTSYLSE